MNSWLNRVRKRVVVEFTGFERDKPIMHRLIYLCIYMPLCLLGLASCYLEAPQSLPSRIPNDIELGPILNLEWPDHVDEIGDIFHPDLLDPSFFSLKKEYPNSLVTYEYLQRGTLSLEIDIWIYDDKVDAEKFFSGECSTYRHKELYVVGQEEDGPHPYQYCIPYLEPEIGEPESLNRDYKTHYYYGLSIQKSNILIVIVEYTEILDRTLVNDVIRQLATAMEYSP